MPGFACPIFCAPAVKVTPSSQTSGTSVVSASATARSADSPCFKAIFKTTVVARHRAMPASIWLEMPKIGQSALTPPSGSRTPMIRKKPQPSTMLPLASRLAPKWPVWRSGFQI